MADNKEIKKFRGGVRLDPQGTPPTNPEKGTVYIDTDGKQYVYDGTSVWVESIDSKNAQTIGGAKNFSDPITLDHESTPSTPASGKVTVYAKDDNQLHILNSDGSEVPIGSGGAGGLDTFFTDDFSTSLAGDFTKVGSGTLAIESSSPINTKSLKYTQSTGAQSVLHTAGYTPTLKQKGNTCSIAFWYTYDGDDDDIKLLVKSTDGSASVTTISSSSDLLKKTSTSKKFITTFTIPSDSTKIQWGFEVATVNNTKVLLIDDVEMSQDPFVQADLGTITEWQTLTNPTCAALTLGDGSQLWKYRRVGDTCHIQGHVQWADNSTTSVSAGETVIFTLPTGFKIDRTKIADSDKHASSVDYPDYVMLEGYASFWSESGTQGGMYRVVQNANAEDQFYIAGKKHEGSNIAWTDTAPETWGNNFQWVFNFSFPVQGWGSTNTHIVTPAKSNLTNWESYTPATTTTDSGSGGSKTGKWRRVGDSMEVVFEILIGNGSIGGSHAIVGLPTSVASGTYKNDYEINATLTPNKSRIVGEFWIAQGADADLNIVSDSGGNSNRAHAIIFNSSYPGFVNLTQQSQTGVDLELNSWDSIGPLGPSDKIYGRFTVPIKEWSAQDHNFLAALPMTKYQKKDLTYSQENGSGWIHKTSNVQGNPGFRFDNLTVGKRYRLILNTLLQPNEQDPDCKVRAYNGGTADANEILRNYVFRSTDPHTVITDYVPGILSVSISGEVIFTAESGTDVDGVTGCFVHFHAEYTDGMIGGIDSAVYERTFAILEELPMHEEVDIW